MATLEVSADEIDLMRHTLGLTQSPKESYRNYFNADPEHSDMPILLSLCQKGLMRCYRANYYCVTDEGKAFMRRIQKFKERA